MTTFSKDNAQWHHATAVARQICARVFRDGGAPADALETFGLAHIDIASNWRDAIDAIAFELTRSGVGTGRSDAALPRAA